MKLMLIQKELHTEFFLLQYVYMKNKNYLIWSAISIIAIIITALALIPALTIGFADEDTRTNYIITITTLVVFTFASLFMVIHYKNKLSPSRAVQAEQASRKAGKYIIITALIAILLVAIFSALNSFS